MVPAIGPDGWAPRRKLDPPVNVNGSEIGALFSPSGRSLLFARDLKGTLSGELFVWHIVGHERLAATLTRESEKLRLMNVA
jgi:hypothetical protein